MGARERKCLLLIHGSKVAGSLSLMDFSDLLPTFAELAGAEPSRPALPGQSFTAALRHPRDLGRDWVFAERGKNYWFRSRRWKLYSDGRFFDMQADPRETSPLPKEGLSRQAAEQKQRLVDAARTIITDR